MTHFGDFQNGVYLQGVAGTLPALPFSYDQLASAAGEVMSPRALGYVAGGAGAEQTMAANRRAFDRWRIVPRMLREVAARDLSTEVCGMALPAPVLLAPVGVLSIVHPEAERAVARAAAAANVPMVLSTAASTSLEDVAAELAGAPAWFQLYWPRDREVARSLVQRAEAAGYRAIVVTVDTWALGWRPRDLQTGYLPFLTGEGLANYLADPAFRAGLAAAPEDDLSAAVLHWVGMFGNPELSWSDFAWLRDQTRLPILVKGICHPDDARAAVRAGADGVIVSNHGGRQVDGAAAALDCLPSVVAAVGSPVGGPVGDPVGDPVGGPADRTAGGPAAGVVPVLFDSGVRTGADVLKAVALGARAVLLGRPYVYGLALGGAEGVRHVLRCLLAETDLTLALSGHHSLGELGPQLLLPAP